MLTPSFFTKKILTKLQNKDYQFAKLYFQLCEKDYQRLFSYRQTFLRRQKNFCPGNFDFAIEHNYFLADLDRTLKTKSYKLVI